jgi:hypothetical protein
VLTVKDDSRYISIYNTHIKWIRYARVMLGPSMAKALYDAVENNIPLDSSINIRRFLPKGE